MSVGGIESSQKKKFSMFSEKLIQWERAVKYWPKLPLRECTYIARTVCRYCFLLLRSFFRKHCLAKRWRFRLRARLELNPVFRRVQLDSEEFLPFIHGYVLRRGQSNSNCEQSVHRSSVLLHWYSNISDVSNRGFFRKKIDPSKPWQYKQTVYNILIVL